MYTVDLELPRGTSSTIALHLLEPPAADAPIVLAQPLVRPLQVVLHDAVCSPDQLVEAAAGRGLGRRKLTTRTIRPTQIRVRAKARVHRYV